jgi:hypothetical protein
MIKLLYFCFLILLLGCMPSKNTFHVNAILLGQTVSMSGRYGEFRNHITIWDCGKYGVMVSENKYVFKKCKQATKLIVADYGDHLEIEGIIT